MSLLSAFNWNEQDTAATGTKDYSGNANDSTAAVITSIIAGETGYVANLDGTDDVLTFGDINSAGDTTSFSIVAKIRIGGSAANPVAYKSGQYEVGIDASQKAYMKIIISAVTYEATSSSSVATGGDYKTVIWTFDGTGGGAGGQMYIDGTLDANTLAQAGSIDDSTSNFLIGSDGTEFAHVRVETLSFYSEQLTQAEVTAVAATSVGIKYETHSVHGLVLGDLITDDPYATTPIEMIVTFLESTTIFYAIPVAGTKINFGRDPIRRGNIGVDTTRQTIMESRVVSGEPSLKVYCDVSTFTLPTPTVQIDCDGITNTGGSIGGYKAITATYTVLATDSFLDITSGTFTATLPTAVGIAGKVYTFKMSGSGVFTLDGNGSETIDDATTATINTQYESISVISDGSNWLIF